MGLVQFSWRVWDNENKNSFGGSIKMDVNSKEGIKLLNERMLKDMGDTLKNAKEWKNDRK